MNFPQEIQEKITMLLKIKAPANSIFGDIMAAGYTKKVRTSKLISVEFSHYLSANFRCHNTRWIKQRKIKRALFYDSLSTLQQMSLRKEKLTKNTAVNWI